MPHRERVDGVVIDQAAQLRRSADRGFHARFEKGRVIDVQAARGEAAMRQLLETDAGSSRLGELALVPQPVPRSRRPACSSTTPCSDENAASHIALGSAYKFTLAGGEDMSDEDFDARRRQPQRHPRDFMIGSLALDIDAVTAGGAVEQLVRRGEWAAAVS